MKVRRIQVEGNRIYNESQYKDDENKSHGPMKTFPNNC